MKAIRVTMLCLAGLAGSMASGVTGGTGGGAMPPAEIVLGMSTALGGAAEDLGKDMRLGVLAGLERANRAGGIHGRRLRLIALDDGYEPARTAPNMRELLEKDKVLAVIGNVGTPTAIAAVPIADENKTLFFAPFTGAGILRRTPPDRYVINYRASYAQETGAMIDALLAAGMQPEDIAFFTQRDGYGDAGFDAGIAELKRRGMKDEKKILHVSYERNTLGVENALASLLYADHQPRAIVMVGAYAPCAKFITLATQAGIKPLFLGVSFVGSHALALALGNTPANVIVTQVVPHPQRTDLPIVRDYVADLKLLDPSAEPGFGSLEGYISARILIRGLEAVQGSPTRENVIDAIEQLGRFDPGFNEELTLGPLDHQASDHVWPTILRDGHFVPLSWKDTPGVLRQEALK